MDKEIDYLINKLTILTEFENNSFFITGATGLIGSQIVKLLLEMNNKKNSEVYVYALCRNKVKAEKMFEKYLGSKYFNIVEGDVRKKIKCDANIDYIIHGASITQSGDFVKYPVETIQTCIYGTENILTFAREKNVKRMIYLSSLEVYGQVHLNRNVKENDYGFIDITVPRSSYSESKRMAECMCCSYSYEYDLDIVIARLTQTFGPGVAYNDNRVFAQFARSVIEEKDIVLHTKGTTIRSYIYIYDVISALFYILLYGESREAYNVANEETAISIYDMANMVAQRYAKSGIEVKIEIPENIETMGYNPEVKIVLDTTKLKELGWKPEMDLPKMYDRLIDSMRIGQN